MSFYGDPSDYEYSSSDDDLSEDNVNPLIPQLNQPRFHYLSPLMIFNHRRKGLT